MRRGGIGAWLVVAACGGDGSMPQPTVDGGVSGDAGAATGLAVDVFADPLLPGTVRSNVVVESATFWVKSLEAVGDAGAGGTTQTSFVLTWDASGVPSPIVFISAAPGLYSKVTLDLDGDLAGPSYEIRGTARIGGGMTMEPFLITDTGGLEIDVENFSVTLQPGGTSTMRVELDLRSVLDLEYDQLDNNNGTWTLDQNHSLIDDLRDDLDSAFKKK